MRSAIIWCTLGFACVAYAAIDADLPSPAPTVQRIFPQGAQRGTTVEVEFGGENLHDAQSIEFTGRGVSGKILAALNGKLKLRVTVDPTAEVGRRDFRLSTLRGVYVGVFDIGALPEIKEAEPNDDLHKPQSISMPVLVNGVLGNEDWDHFSVTAAAGETIVFDVSATRHGSRLDADLAVLDDHGQELAWNDDTTIFGDPHLEYTFAKAGHYIVRVGSLSGGGNYRLSVGLLPYIRRTFPAGLTAGQLTTLTLTGAHMDLVDEVWIGDRSVRGSIIKKSSEQLKASFRVSKNLTPGRYLIHASHAGYEIAIPTELRVSSLPEIAADSKPVSLQTAIPVTPSLVANGIIGQPGITHYFRFNANAGDTYTFRAESMKLGYHLDPTLTLLDAEGKKLAYADDPGVDERSDEFQLDTDLSYRFEKAGTYYVAIRDGMYRGGDQLVYRLTLQQMAPDFILELREPVRSFYQGQSDSIQARVRRRAGWNTPVEVWAEGLPQGTEVERQTAAAKDSFVKDTCGVDRTVDGTMVSLPIRVGDHTAFGHSDFVVKARGVMNGVTVEHSAIVRYQNLSAGFTYGPMQQQRAQLTIAKAPAVILNLPDTISIAPGDERKLKIAVRRFGELKQQALRIQPHQMPSGFSSDPITVPVGAKNIEVIVKTNTKAVSTPLIFEVISEDNRPVGQSPPVLFEIKPKTQVRN